MLNQLKQNALDKIAQAKNLKDLDALYRLYLGRKGELTKVLRSLKDLSEKERKETGLAANKAKQELEEAIGARREKLSAKGERDESWLDVTAPGVRPAVGHSHPISLVQRQIEDIFQSMGFSVVDGPEVETEYYNFDALNIPKDHPARDLWDTFWLRRLDQESQKSESRPRQGRASGLKDVDLLLRTHTSPMQARYMEKNNPPLRIIVPGRCFRHEATNATHEAQFYQFEGLMVGKDVSVANFKGVIEAFLKKFFGQETEIRLRPGYFPFVEPGFEIDAKRKGGKWLEMMGAGMVHPNVFKAAGYKPGEWQGFAFGAGIDRLAMLKYKISDIRLFYSSDLRFLRQF